MNLLKLIIIKNSNNVCLAFKLFIIRFFFMYFNFKIFLSMKKELYYQIPLREELRLRPEIKIAL